MKLTKALTFTFLLIWLVACQPDPRKDAQAFATRIEAEQDALNQEQNRQHAEQAQQIYLEQLKVEQAHREATAAEWRAGLNMVIHYGSIFATIAVCLMLVAFGISFSWTSIGIAKAAARGAFVKANLIYLDPKTRQFPLLVQHIHGSIYLGWNPNTGEIKRLDENNPADRQMIATAGATQYAGVIAQEARQSKDPAAFSVMQPNIVDVVETKDSIKVGQIGGPYE